MKLKIRDGRKKDKAWLFDLYYSTMKSFIEQTWGWNDEFQQHGFETNLRPEYFQVVTDEGIDVGAFLVVNKEDHLWLEMLLVEKNNQNDGIGTWVMECIIKESAERNLPIKLSVIKLNPAKFFYLGLGFSVYEEDDAFYRLERRI